MSELQPRYQVQREEPRVLPADQETKAKEMDGFHRRVTIHGYSFALSLILVLAGTERAIHSSDERQAGICYALALLSGAVGLGSHAETTRRSLDLTHRLYAERERYERELAEKEREIRERDRKIAAYGLDDPSQNDFIE